MNLSAINYPGPGKYNQNNDNTTNAPKWSFGKSDRFEKLQPKNPKMQKLIVPGPGSYSNKKFIGEEGPRYSFNKEKYNHSDSMDESMMRKILKYPSPGTYLQNIAFVSDKPKYSIPKMERKDEFNNKFRIACPGPEKYSPNIDVSSSLKRAPSWVINKPQNETSEKSTKKISYPGPGSYDIKYGNLPQGPIYTIKGSNEKIKIKQQPGPGAYNINDLNRPSEPKYSIGKEERDDYLKSVKRDAFPGPGAYKMVEVNSAPKISFTKDERNKKNMDKVPGPGFYKIPTSFDNINDMTRSCGGFDPAFQYV